MLTAIRQFFGIGRDRQFLAMPNTEIAAGVEAAFADPIQMLRNHECERSLLSASATERATAALAAPYRETYLDEIDAATQQGRSAVYLLTRALPPQGASDFIALLDRDFGIVDRDDAEWVCADVLKHYDAAKTKRASTADLTRLAHIALASSQLNLMPLGRALAYGQEAIRRVAHTCSDWDDYAGAFLRSEGKGGSSAWQKRYLSEVVGTLLIHPISPWQTIDWHMLAEGEGG
ncbi:MAG: DUF1266 domain-containing protein [Pontixanthobacter sp.]